MIKVTNNIFKGKINSLMKMEGLNLYYLKYFFDTVESQSLTKAAQLNFITRPAISLAIKRLEDWSEKKLITHQRKVFALTKEGEDFYRLAHASYQIFKESLESKMRQQDRVIKIGCSASLFDRFLIPSLTKMKTLAVPQVKIGPTSLLMSLLEENKINIAIYIDNGHPSLIPSQKIFSGNFILASKSGSFTSHLITTELRPETIELKKIISKSSHSVAQEIKVESWSMAMKLAVALNAMCLIPDCVLDSRLKKISYPKFQKKYDVVIAHKKREFLSRTEVDFLDRLIQ